MFVILISGASGSGKSLLAEKVVQFLLKKQVDVQLIKTDDYFNTIPDGVDIDYFRKTSDFDKPDAVNLEQLSKDLNTLSNKSNVQKPVFYFQTNTNTYELMTPSDLIVVEGLHSMRLRNMLSDKISILSVSVTSSHYKTIIERRASRDVLERGRESPEEVKKYERCKVGPAFFTYIAPSFSGCDLQIINDPHENKNSDHPLDRGVIEIVEAYENKLKQINVNVMQSIVIS